jgi:hypothetical protein
MNKGIPMRRKAPVFLAVLLLLFAGAPSLTSNAEKPITPYGDYCSRLSHYGTGKNRHSHKRSEKALKHYYNSRGFDVEITTVKGRFIKAQVKKSGELVDTIILDRHTGRIRSIN